MSTKQYLRNKYKTYKNFTYELLQAELLINNTGLTLLKSKIRDVNGTSLPAKMRFDDFAEAVEIGLDEF